MIEPQHKRDLERIILATKRLKYWNKKIDEELSENWINIRVDIHSQTLGEQSDFIVYWVYPTSGMDKRIKEFGYKIMKMIGSKKSPEKFETNLTKKTAYRFEKKLKDYTIIFNLVLD